MVQYAPFPVICITIRPFEERPDHYRDSSYRTYFCSINPSYDLYVDQTINVFRKFGQIQTQHYKYTRLYGSLNSIINIDLVPVLYTASKISSLDYSIVGYNKDPFRRTPCSDVSFRN